MNYEISEIKNGQYRVEIDLKGKLTPTALKKMHDDLSDLVKNDPFLTDRTGNHIITINRDILSYTSETIFPGKLNPGKEKVLLIFGNPATHSVKYGMFCFSKGEKFARHGIWKKLHDAMLMRQVDCGNPGKSPIEIRTEEADKKRAMILAGDTSDKYLLSLTTFYSFPTPVVKDYKFSNVAGVLRLFGPMIDSINKMETKRILDYPFSADATLVFLQKSSYETFKKNVSNSIRERVIYWPAVSRKKDAKKSGADLLEELENLKSSMPTSRLRKHP